jgi:protein-disulfide isomerase
MSKLHTFIASLKHKTSAFSLSTPAAIIIAALILGGSHLAYGLISSGNSASGAPVTLFTGKPIDATDLVEGKDTSKVYVVEYSDPECPFCISAHPTIKQLRTEYGDKVAFVYRYFPLTQIHPHSYDESKAIACAATLGGKNAFYTYIDQIYGYKSNNQTTQLPPTGKEDIAGTVGLDKVAFAKCESDQSTAAIIDASLNDGVQAGVQGTPTTFVLLKTKKGLQVVANIDGARPYSFFKAAIDQAIAMK